MNITTTVMSSIDWDYLFHWVRAADTNALAAASGASLAKKGWTIAATYAFDKNSQIPSEANRTILSEGFNIVWLISGSQEQPTEWATVSPIDLDIAKPGEFTFFTQTLCGPLNLPLQSWACRTLPPLDWTLAFSLGSSGLWSVVKLLVLGALSLSSNEIRMHLESPQLAVNNWLPLKKQEVRVVPESYTLKTLLISCSNYALMTEL